MSGRRCIVGRMWEHRPQPDDPDFEVDMGPCPDAVSCDCDWGLVVNGDPVDRAYSDLQAIMAMVRPGERIRASEAFVVAVGTVLKLKTMPPGPDRNLAFLRFKIRKGLR